MSEIISANTTRRDSQESALASGRLRSTNGGFARIAEGDGLVDAFAEVFASIAASSSQPVEYSQEDSISDVTVRSRDPQTEDAEASSSDSERDGERDESGQEVVDSPVANLQPVLVENEEPGVEANLPTDEVEQGDSSNDAESIDIQPQIASVETPDQTTVEDIDVGAQPILRYADASGQEHTNDEKSSQQPKQTEQFEPLVRTTTDEQISEGVRNKATGGEEDGVAVNVAQQQDAEGRESDGKRRRSRGERRDHFGNGSPQTPAPRNVQQREIQAHLAGLEELTTPAASAAAPADQSTSAVTPQRTNQNSNAAVGLSATPAVERTTTAVRSVSRLTAVTGSEGNGRTDPNQLVEGKTKQGKAEATASETVSRVKLIQRVSRAFQHLGNEGGMIRLRLAPAELGAVKVEMQIQSGSVQARVVAETEAASNALREHLPDLRARLESFGMQIESIEVETEAQGQNSQFAFSDNQFQRNPRRHATGDKSSQDNSSNEVNAEPTPVSQTANTRQAQGGVDIRF